MNSLYQSSNITLAIVGKFDIEEVKTIVKDLFIETDTQSISSPQKIQIIEHAKKVQVVPYQSEQLQVILGFPNTITYDHPDRYPMLIIATLLGGAASARLFHKLVYELGIAYSMGSYSTVGRHVGDFSIFGGFTKNNVEKAIRVILEELTYLKKIKLTVKELQEVKAKTKANVLFYTETTDTIADMYASQLLTEKKITSLDEIAERIDSVTIEDIYKVANAYLVNSNILLLIQGAVDSELIDKLESLLNDFIKDYMPQRVLIR